MDTLRRRQAEAIAFAITCGTTVMLTAVRRVAALCQAPKEVSSRGAIATRLTLGASSAEDRL